MLEEKRLTGIARLPQPSLCDGRVPVAVAAVPRPLAALGGLVNTLRVPQQHHLDRHAFASTSTGLSERQENARWFREV